MELEAFVRHFRTAFPDLEKSDVVVALSGGADSTALLHLLNRAELGLTLHAVHVHHGSRGVEADEDGQFCFDLCRTLGIAFTMARLTNTERSGKGREAAWRTLRYAALSQSAAKVGAAAIATAHHQDDVAEGTLLQLLRGAGPRAMAGIHTRDGNVIRPLLPFSGPEIRNWLIRNDLEWREDSSNEDPGHLRNRVRHEVLPMLEGVAPAIRTHLIRHAHALADSENSFAQDLDTLDLWIDPWHPDGGILIKKLASLPRALQIRWLHAQAARVGLPGVTHRQGQLLPEVISGSSPSLTLADRWALRRAGKRLWLEPGRSIPPYGLDLKADQEIGLPVPGWHIALRDTEANDISNPWIFPVADKTPLHIRTLQAEDRFPDGRRPMTILRAFLPRHLRRIWPILFGDDKLLWIPGVAAETVSVDGPRIVEVTRK